MMGCDVPVSWVSVLVRTVERAFLWRVACVGRKTRKAWATLWLGVFADVELTLETLLTLQEEQSRNCS